MSLHNLKREYEDRRQALIDQLQKNHTLDAATQHQIYGAIKEIESFLSTIDYQIATEQQRNINIELSREKPNPFAERTKNAFRNVHHGTKRVFTHHIPSATRAVVGAPKRFFDRRREEARLRAEIEREIRARKEGEHTPTTQEPITDIHHHASEHQGQWNHELHPPQEPHQSHQSQQTWHQPSASEEAEEIAEVRALNQEASAHEEEIVAKRPAGRKPVLKVDRPGKRQKAVAKSTAKKKVRPGLNAKNKKGGQHKPHLKRDKYSRR